MALALSLFVVSPVYAQSRYELPAPLRVGTVARLAQKHRPEILAARANARAAAERPRMVSGLNDPMVMASIDHLPLSGMGVDASLTVQQEFPFSSVRSRRVRAAEADARSALSETARVKLDVALDAVNAYYMLLERRRMAVVLEQIETSSKQLSAVATAHYGAAHGTQAEVLRAENEVLRIQGERRAIKAEMRAAEAMLNAALGRDPDLSIPELQPPALDRSPPNLSAAVARALSKRPELATMRHRKVSAEANVDVMNSMYSPMGIVRAGPSYTMAEGMGVMVMVGVSVPIWRDRLDAGVDEAHAMVRMANAESAAMKNMVRGEVAVARENVVAARIRLDSLRNRIVPTAEQTVESAIASYAAAQTSGVAVVEAVRTLWDVRSEEVMAEVRLGLAWARLRRTMGETAPEGAGK